MENEDEIWKIVTSHIARILLYVLTSKYEILRFVKFRPYFPIDLSKIWPGIREFKCSGSSGPSRLFRTDQSKSIFKCFTTSGYHSFKSAGNKKLTRIREIIFTYRISEVVFIYQRSEDSLIRSGRIFTFQINEYSHVISDFSHI